MLKLKSKLLTSIVSLSFCALCMANTASAAPIDFNYQAAYMGPHVFNLEVGQPWAKNLESFSKGELKAHYFQDGGLVKGNDMVHSLVAGTVDMGSYGLTFATDIAPIMGNSSIGFITDNAEHGTSLLYKLYEENKEIQDELAKIGKILNMWTSDRTGFFSAVGPIKSLADLKGKRVLVWGGQNVAVIKAWGGVPVQVLPSDTYLGLQRGMGDVFLGPLPAGVSYKFMEVAKDITPINAISVTAFTWVSWDLWNDMSSTQQKQLEDSTKNWGKDLASKLVNVTKNDFVTMKKAGCTIHELSDAEIKKFADISREISIDSISKEFKRHNVKKDATQWVNYLYKLSDETRAK